MRSKEEYEYKCGRCEAVGHFAWECSVKSEPAMDVIVAERIEKLREQLTQAKAMLAKANEQLDAKIEETNAERQHREDVQKDLKLVQQSWEAEREARERAESDAEYSEQDYRKACRERDAALARAEGFEAALEALANERAELEKILGKGPYVPLHQYEELRKQFERAAVEHLSAEGQCIEEHHWKGNCPLDKAVEAAYAERDMHWKATVTRLRTAGQKLADALKRYWNPDYERFLCDAACFDRSLCSPDEPCDGCVCNAALAAWNEVTDE